MRALGRLPKGQMNKTEQCFEAEIILPAVNSGEIAWYCFEGVKLMLAPNTSITVDFPVMLASGLIEMIDVKGAAGMVTDDGWAKLKIAAALYPFVFKTAIPKPKKAGGGWTIEEVGR